MRTYSHWLDEEHTLCGRKMDELPCPHIAVFKDEVTCLLCNEALNPSKGGAIIEAAHKGTFKALEYRRIQ